MLGWRALLLCLATGGCRIGFDVGGGGGGGDAGGGDAGVDGSGGGPTQVAWVRRLVPTGAVTGKPAQGRGAGTVLVGRFTGALTREGAAADPLVAPPGALATAYVVQYDAAGSERAATLLGSDTSCDLRDAAHTELGLVAVGLTAGAGGGERGPCDVAVTRQSPITFLIDATGLVTRHALFPASGGNAQAWSIAPLPGGYGLAGVYSGDVALTPPPPSAAGDEASFFTNVSASGTSSGGLGWRNGSFLMPGPLASAPDGDVCLLGSYDSASTVIGAGLTPLGGFDAWVARFSAAGQRRFVASVRSPGDETAFGNGAVLATTQGCVTAGSVGDVALVGATSYPYAGGTDASVFVFDGAGAGTGFTVGGAGNEEFQALLDLGGRWLAIISYDAPLTLAGTLLTPGGTDLALVEVDAAGVRRVHAVFGGAGLQGDGQLGQIDDDTVTVTLLSSGDLDVAGQASTSDAPVLVVVAVDVGG